MNFCHRVYHANAVCELMSMVDGKSPKLADLQSYEDLLGLSKACVIS